MGNKHSSVLRLRPWSEIDCSVPSTGVQCLPGRIAALSHPQTQGLIHMPERDDYAPDVATVVSSGVRTIVPGVVVVLAPDHGAFYGGLSEDGREMRIVGVVKPWWESVVGLWGENGLATTPGWVLVERDRKPEGPLLLSDGAERWEESGYVVSDCAPDSSLEGERIVFKGERRFTFDSCLPESLCAVRCQNCSKKYMRSLETVDKVYV